jgi:hypothetical protein
MYFYKKKRLRDVNVSGSIKVIKGKDNVIIAWS